MIIDILTLFPEMFEGVINSSIIKKVIEKGLVTINLHDYREFSTKQNKRVDDYSYGGGAGMIIEVAPVVNCLRSISGFESARKIITLPTGEKYNQKKAEKLKEEKHIVIICGHYEGIDDRIMNYVDEAISIGDFILTGGEIAALSIIDSVIRLLPDALGNDEAIEIESFENGLLEYPQYTRPVSFEGLDVPEVLMNGNHEHIRKWRKFKQIEITYKYRPDLLDAKALDEEGRWLYNKVINGESFDGSEKMPKIKKRRK